MCKKIETNENFFSLGEILVREISPELLKQESETGDILGCNATGEKILTTTGYGNLNVRSSNLSGREPLIDFARNQIYQRIRPGISCGEAASISAPAPRSSSALPYPYVTPRVCSPDF